MSRTSSAPYVEKTLDANAVPVATGICLVFKDAMEEQLFLLARQQVRREWRLLRREPDGEAVASTIRDHGSRSTPTG